TAMRSAADIAEVGCPDPAAALIRTESTRNCCPSSSRSVAFMAAILGFGFPAAAEKVTWRHGHSAGRALVARRQRLGRFPLAGDARDRAPRTAHRGRRRRRSHVEP